MGFTGSLLLARTPVPLTDLDALAPHQPELLGRRDNHWQLAAVIGHVPDPSQWAAGLVAATTAPVLLAVIADSDIALLLADSPTGRRWAAVLNNPPTPDTADTTTPHPRALTATAHHAVAWAAEAGQTAHADTLTQALHAADRDNRAADQAMRDAADDIAALTEITRNPDRVHRDLPAAGPGRARARRTHPGHRLLLGASDPPGTHPLPIALPENRGREKDSWNMVNR